MREFQYYSLERDSKVCPFPLADLPRVVGSWQLVEGKDAKLDPEIARIAGSSDHFVRVYRDRRTGEEASVLVLYGLAAGVSMHTARVCYPAAGYAPERPMVEYDLKLPGIDKLAHYGGGIFSKSQGGATEYVEVVCSFRHADLWLADAADRWKTFRYHPGCFKIQIGRVCNEFAIATSPSVELLQDLILEIEKRLPQKTASTEIRAQPGSSGPEKNAN